MVFADFSEIIERIRKDEERKKELGKILRENSQALSEAGEFFEKCMQVNLHDFKVVGIDGGLLNERMHGLDILIARGVGVLFHYNNDSLSKAEYLPINKNLEISEFYSRDQNEFRIFSSLKRLESEIKAALFSTETNPDMILLHGPIIPSYIDKPRKDSDLMQIYDRTISLYRKLFETCISNKIMLAGIIEDSLSCRVCNFVSEKLKNPDFKKFRDSEILYYCIEAGERTKSFPYSENFSDNKILRDLNFPENLQFFYLKANDNEIPIRIDFLKINKERFLNNLVGIIYRLCIMNRSYSIPAVLIEADQRARLKQADVEILKSHIKARLGPYSTVREMRRKRRPF